MIPVKNEIYRHFKGNLYKIVTLAKNSETEEDMVVYQALYGDYQVYVRTLSDFLSSVDTEKYPDATQMCRFERVEGLLNNGEDQKTVKKKESDEPDSLDEPDTLDEYKESNEPEKKIDPMLLEFLEAEEVTEKENILTAMKHRITNEMITAMALSMDLVIDEGDVLERYRQLKNCLAMKERFETDRPRG